MVLAGAGAAGLAWRLSQGPLDVTRLARWAEERALAGGTTRLEFGRASVAWAGFGQGAGRALELRLEDARLVGAGGPTAEAAQADIDLSLAGLLSGKALPQMVQLTGLRLRLARSADGRISLGQAALGPASAGAPSLPGILAALARPATADYGGLPPALRILSQLRQVRVQDAVVQVTDPALGEGRLSGDMDLQRAPEGGVTGTAAVRLAMGLAEARLALRAELAEAGTRIEATLSPIDTAALAAVAPMLAPLKALEGAVRLVATAELTPTLALRHSSVRANMDRGLARPPGATLPLEGVVLDAAAAWDPAAPALLPRTFVLNRLQAAVAMPDGAPPTTLAVTGSGARADGRLHGTMSATLDRLAFAQLGALWPSVWGGNVRPWIVQNITAGTARDGQATLTLEAAEDGAGFRVTQATASLHGEDASIHWLRPVLPIEHAQAVLTMRDVDSLEIAIPAARQGAMQLRDGMVRITGLSKKDQDLSVTAGVQGGVPELLMLLRHPRLKLLDKSPLPINNPAGTLNGKLSVTLPLKKNLEFEEVGIHAEGRLTGLRLGGLVAKRDLDRGDVLVDVTQDGLKANGAATLGGIPGQLAVELDFRSGGPDQVVQRANVSGRATPRQLAAAGLDAEGLLAGGTTAFTAEYSARRDGRGDVQVQADLRDSAISVAGWTKAPGQPANARGRLLLNHGKLQGIDGVQAQGPGMEVRGRAEMVGNTPSRLVLDRIVLGPTRASGQVELPSNPDQPLRASLTGTVLDLSAKLSRQPTPKPGASEEPGTALVADLRFDRVLLAGGHSISGVSGHVEYDGERLNALRLQSSGAERIQAVVVAEGRSRRVSVRAADGGAVLRALDVTGTVRGGSLAVEARYDDTRPGSPLSGTANLSDFHVTDAPVLGKVLQAVTVYGIPDALSGPGLAFSRLIMPFRWDGQVLDIGETQAFSASLGLTVKGQVDVTLKQVDVTGTIVPAYVLNSALGRLPLVGRLFSPERGGGLVAVEYSVRGPLADPAVGVNPLSALTPGFLRQLFRLFD